MAHFFNADVSRVYDEKNSRLAPVAENLHFLIRLVLQDLPQDARVLCVGAGTGAEILSLAKEYPGWTFVGVDPSAPMLDVCRVRLEQAGILDRCTLIHGYVQDAPHDERFDAVLSILVAHFIPRADRAGFYKGIMHRLKSGGYYISAEISCDFDAPEFPSMLENWARVQALMGATPPSLHALSATLRETLCILTPAETETLWRASGIDAPARFFQSFMVCGWFGRRESNGVGK